MKIKFFNLAKKVSKLATHHSHSIGAVVTKRNKLLSVGYNQMKTHPESPHPNKCIHAELKAILSADLKDLQGASIYVYRETKNGVKALSKPCRYCHRLIKDVGIKTIYYTDIDSYKVEVL